MSMTSIDREGIGMLYAMGAGLYAGASVSYATEPLFGWLLGSAAVGIGLLYEFYQRVQS